MRSAFIGASLKLVAAKGGSGGSSYASNSNRCYDGRANCEGGGECNTTCIILVVVSLVVVYGFCMGCQYVHDGVITCGGIVCYDSDSHASASSGSADGYCEKEAARRRQWRSPEQVALSEQVARITRQLEQREEEAKRKADVVTVEPVSPQVVPLEPVSPQVVTLEPVSPMGQVARIRQQLEQREEEKEREANVVTREPVSPPASASAPPLHLHRPASQPVVLTIPADEQLAEPDETRYPGSSGSAALGRVATFGLMGYPTDVEQGGRSKEE